MSNLDVVRAWKDESYRNSLSEAERAMLPANPAGPIELTEEQLEVAGANTWHAGTMGCGCVFITIGYTCIGFTVCGLVCNTAFCTYSCP